MQNGESVTERKSAKEVEKSRREERQAMESAVSSMKPDWLKKYDMERRVGDVAEDLVEAVENVDPAPVISNRQPVGRPVKPKRGGR
jgi:hypothetical protein